MLTVDGKCLCGKVQFKVSLKNHEVITCHCSLCRRWTGGIILAMAVENTLVFIRKETFKFYKSSEHARRGFCKNCGSSLIYPTTDGGITLVNYPALNLSPEDSRQLQLTMELFTDRQPDSYCFKNKTIRFSSDLE